VLAGQGLGGVVGEVLGITGADAKTPAHQSGGVLESRG